MTLLRDCLDINITCLNPDSKKCFIGKRRNLCCPVKGPFLAISVQDICTKFDLNLLFAEARRCHWDVRLL